MAQTRKISRKQIFVSDWLEWKPSAASPVYDKYYVGIANKVLNILKKHKHWFGPARYNNTDYKELAIVLTSYFEDFINEIGIWNVFVQTNKELYGYYLPFYDMEDYYPDDLNPQDLSFLIWFHMFKCKNRVTGPDAPSIEHLSEEIFNLFDSHIDKAYATNLYTDFFTISENIDFFDLKNRLLWFALSSYLLKLDFGRKEKVEIEKYAKENEKMGVEMLNYMRYGLKNDFLFKRKSSFSALSTVEWFAELVNCSEDIKQDILSLKKLIGGSFLYQDHTQTHYQFLHLQSDKIFEVHRESVNIDTDKAQKEDLNVMELVRWKEDWWVSGSMFIWGQVGKEGIEKMKSQSKGAPFYSYSKEEREQMREDAKEMGKGFSSFFGGPMAIFDNENDMHESTNEFIGYYNQKRFQPEGEKTNDQNEFIHKAKNIKADFSKLDFEKELTTALFFIEGNGIQINPQIPKIIGLMQKERLTDQESYDLFYDFFNSHPQICRYLLDNFPVKNLQYPISITEMDVSKHTEFFMRFFNPGNFKGPIPNVTLQ